jgi:tetratricopeptide (TPR) repeat protein
MKTTAVILTVLILAAAACSAAEEFNWSWEQGRTNAAVVAGSQQKEPVAVQSAGSRQLESVKRSDGQSVPEAADSAPAPGGRKPDADDNFFWAWEKKATDAAAARPAGTGGVSAAAETQKPPAEIEPVTPPAVAPPVVVPPETVSPVQKPVVTSGIDSKAYEELIKENLELHRKIGEIKQDKDLAIRQNEKLTAELRDLEQRIAASVSQIKELGKQKDAAAGSPGKVKQLEAKLIQAEEEKARLGSEIDDLKKRMARQTAPSAPARQVTVAQPAPAVQPASGIKPGSDLYSKLESENITLKQKLVELEVERQRAIKAAEEKEAREKLAAAEARRAQDSQKDMKSQLDDAKASEKKQKKLMTELAGRIPDMEKELSDLQKKVTEKDMALKDRERNLEALAHEVAQRENRIKKAERMVVLMEQAQKDVSTVSESEKRDMHYNMGSVYAQMGRYRDAEREYLHALQIDPTDADVHYNLGIIYDENLHDKQRAAMYYRRYLKLRPSGPDVDAVKNWLLNLEVRQ